MSVSPLGEQTVHTTVPQLRQWCVQRALDASLLSTFDHVVSREQTPQGVQFCTSSVAPFAFTSFDESDKTEEEEEEAVATPEAFTDTGAEAAFVDVVEEAMVLLGPGKAKTSCQAGGLRTPIGRRCS